MMSFINRYIGITSIKSVLFLFILSVQLTAQSDKPVNTKLIQSDDTLLSFIELNPVNEVSYNPFETKLNYNILGVVGAGTILAGVGIHIYQYHAWWKDLRRSFHFNSDWEYALWLDKVGHFYAGGILAHAFSSALEAGNFQSEEAAIYGTALAFLYQTYVEFEDGFGPDWGFSIADEAANTLGASYTLAQYYFPYLKNFMFRFSYLPSNKPKFGFRPGGGIDDYEGQKYWLSFRMKNLLPEGISKYWPEFLMLSAGVSVKELDGNGGGHREFYIALDIDAETIPLYGGFWQFLKNSLNYIHFPMPGVRISPDAAFFVLCF
jgi:hypothetical protein